jgi:hypothetical protein
LQKQTEIILLGGSAGLGLAPTKPTLWSEMLEKGDQPAAPIMVARFGRQRTGYRLRPPLMIDEAGIRNGARADLAQRSGLAALVCNDGCAVGDGGIRSIFQRLSHIALI